MKENCTPKDSHEEKEIAQQLKNRECSLTKAEKLMISQ